MKEIKRYSVFAGKDLKGDPTGVLKVRQKGEVVTYKDHLAALEAAKNEAVVEWLKSIKAKCRIPCDPSCKFSSLCYMRAEYWDNEAIQKAAEV